MKTIFLSAVLIFLINLPFPAFSQPKSKTGSEIQYGQNSKNGRYIQTRGFRMYFEVYGKGEPALLIHGNSGSIESMKYQIPWFAKKYQVIAVDSRAHGKSIDPSDSLSYEMMADDFNALLDSLHLDSAFVIGWSDGGINGLELAIRHPDKVKKLAATGANIRPDTTALSNAEIQSMIQQVNLLSHAEQYPELTNQTKLIRMMIYQPNISQESLRTIKCPTLVIGGDHDIIKPEHTLEIFRSIPGSQLWILPGSGHNTLIDFKDDFNEQVGNFFSAVR
ncbi:MAG: alpha/beta hydrolase [Bacteroidota bacterium]